MASIRELSLVVLIVSFTFNTNDAKSTTLRGRQIAVEAPCWPGPCQTSPSQEYPADAFFMPSISPAPSKAEAIDTETDDIDLQAQPCVSQPCHLSLESEKAIQNISLSSTMTIANYFIYTKIVTIYILLNIL